MFGYMCVYSTLRYIHINLRCSTIRYCSFHKLIKKLLEDNDDEKKLLCCGENRCAHEEKASHPTL